MCTSNTKLWASTIPSKLVYSEATFGLFHVTNGKILPAYVLHLKIIGWICMLSKF